MAGTSSSIILVPRGFHVNMICEAAPLLQRRKHLRDWSLTGRRSAENGKKLLFQTSLKQMAFVSKGFLAEQLSLARKFEECSRRQNSLDRTCEGGAELKRQNGAFRLRLEARTALLSQKDAPKLKVAGGFRIEPVHNLEESQKDGAGNKATSQQAGIPNQPCETADFGGLSDGVIAAIQKHDPGVILESNDELVRECWRMRKERKSNVTDDQANRMVALIGLKTLR
jgi:hypothetical protein